MTTTPVAGGSGPNRSEFQHHLSALSFDHTSLRTKDAMSNTATSKSKSDKSSPFTFKTNGEKGAEAHTVSEQTRIRFTKMLLDMRESAGISSIEMPTDLTNTERKFIHLIAAQLGLKSKSSGKGENRRITISKIKESRSTKDKIDVASAPPLKLNPAQTRALEMHLQLFPPNQLEFADTESPIIDNFASDLLEDEDVACDGDEVVLNQSLDHPSTVDVVKRTQWHHEAQRLKSSKPRFREMQSTRSKLPAYAYRDEICAAVRNHRIILIQGDTGCGKSTQVVQFLLDDPWIGPTANIIVTQPRRISAISIAERIAAERCEEVGSTIGYSVRLDTASSHRTQVLFVTPGVLLRRFLANPDLDDYTIIVIDEIHERDKYTEFLLIILRDLVRRRPFLRIIMMSATIQTHELIEYWTGVADEEDIGYNEDTLSHHHHIPDSHLCSRPAEIFIPGRTFPVQDFYLEDILSMTGYVDKEELSTNKEMDRIEADMAALLNTTTGTNNVQLTCVMCGRNKFTCPEELGAHVAFCDGGGKNQYELEEKIRNIEGSGRASNIDSNYSILSPSTEIEFNLSANMEDIDNDPELIIDKWDGESPFNVTDTLLRTQTTLTEEELLRRYQQSHDDDEVDDLLIVEVVKLIHRSSYGDGAILIFLPGWQDISELSLLLENTKPFNNKASFMILPLHSGIPSSEQRRVFSKPSAGVRKIILATNIAETSLTIEDVAFVIDSGRAKEKNYDPHLKTSTLQAAWISQASAKQRRGRAGRTKAGVAFHLFSRRRYDSLRPFLESELLRTPLEELCLLCKRLGLTLGGEGDDNGIPAFLAAALSPPHPKSVLNALELLVDIGAMEPQTNDLTHLGRCLASLSLEPRVGKMVLWSYILGVARAASSMAVAMSHKSPFILPPASMQRYADQAKVEFGEGCESDQITILNVLKAYDTLIKRGRSANVSNFCRSKFINEPTIRTIAETRGVICRELTSLDFLDPSDMTGWQNRNGHKLNLAILQAAITAGLYPNVAFRVSGDVNFSTGNKRKARIHMSSVNASAGQPLGSKCKIQQGEIELIVYGELVRGSSNFTVSQTSHLSSPLPLLLLCGNVRCVVGNDGKDGVLIVDENFSFSTSSHLASALVILRRRLNRAFSLFVSSPANGWNNITEQDKSAIDSFIIMLKAVNTKR